MREEEWILTTEDESGIRRVRAHEYARDGGICRFTAGGASYTVERGAVLRVECEGELSYALEFDLLRATAAELATPYGSLPVEVRTHALSFAEEGGFEAEYTLYFGGEPSRRKIAYAPARAGGKHKKRNESAPAEAGADKEGI